MLIVFPGQGSQKVGMGADIYENFVCAREVFKEVDDAISFNLSDLIFNGSEDELKLTQNAQPAIMTVSIAFLRVLVCEFGFNLTKSARFFAGHSLGEYTALCAAGVLSLSDTASILQIRGKAMADACPNGGAMAAIIGLDLENIKEIIASVTQRVVQSGLVLQIANENSPRQTIISGHTEAIEYAIEAAKEAGAKRALMLEVSGPFHSALMQSAEESLKKKFETVRFFTPSCPIITNVTAKPETNGFKELLLRQLTSPVRWTATVQWAKNEGEVSTALEIGPGKVLAGLIKQIDSGIIVNNVNSLESLSTYL